MKQYVTYVQDPSHVLTIDGLLLDKVPIDLRKPRPAWRQVVKVKDAELYLQARAGKPVLVNGELHALSRYQRDFFLRTDLDSIDVTVLPVGREESVQAKEEKREYYDYTAAVDADLIVRAQAHDTVAFGELYRRYHSKIQWMILGVIHNSEIAKELTQDTFMKAYKYIDTFQADSQFYTWLHVIGKNVAFDYLRTKKRRGASYYDESEEVPQVVQTHPEHIGSSLERKELSDILKAALSELSPEHRIVLQMLHYKDMSYKEIAAALGIAEGTVMSRIYYARERIRVTHPELKGYFSK